ncbi:macrophage colony-stimulating factor 1 receptor-like isoform X2 [Acanthaster planci]|nr:macrophage colony-stimulating factor 1 receptor-like isoform X2 [Acanthaster planci]
MIAPNNCPPEIYGIMQRCWQDNPKSRCTFQQVANLLESLLSEDNDYTALTGAGRAGENQAEPPEHPNESYLVPKQMETAFGVEGPWNVDEGAGGSGVPPAHDRSNYVNKAVTR